jgi:hypothetical protein
MNLYGASLRKGEVPDEISRNCEHLTEIFVEKANDLKKKSNDPTVVKAFEAAFNDYIQFAKIEL